MHPHLKVFAVHDTCMYLGLLASPVTVLIRISVHAGLLKHVLRREYGTFRLSPLQSAHSEVGVLIVRICVAFGELE